MSLPLPNNESAEIFRVVQTLRKPGIIGYLTFATAVLAAAAGLFSAYIYKNQLDTSREQEKLQFRSYLGAESLSLVEYAKPVIKIAFTVKNYGITPGSKVDYSFNYDFFVESKNGVYSIGDVSDWNVENGNIIPPSNSLTWSDSITLNTVQMDYLSRSDGVLVLSGLIKYADIFSDVHTTPFCFSFRHQEIVKTIAIGENDEPSKGVACPLSAIAK